MPPEGKWAWRGAAFPVVPAWQAGTIPSQTSGDYPAWRGPKRGANKTRTYGRIRGAGGPLCDCGWSAAPVWGGRQFGRAQPDRGQSPPPAYPDGADGGRDSRWSGGGDGAAGALGRAQPGGGAA